MNLIRKLERSSCRDWAAAFTVAVALSPMSGSAVAHACSRWDRVEYSGSIRSEAFQAVGYGGGKFIVAEYMDYYLSSDGVSWHLARCQLPGSQCWLRRSSLDFAWNGDEFITSGRSGANVVFRIREGQIEVAGVCDPGNYFGVVYDGSRYVAVGKYATAISFDSEVWFDRPTPDVPCDPWSDDTSLNSVCWTGDQWVSVGYGSCGAVVATSPDGETWSARLVDGFTLNSVDSNGELVIAVGDESIASADGQTWNEVQELPDNMRSITWSGSEWLAARANGEVYSSDDGTDWTHVASATGCLNGIAADASLAVAVGEQTMILRGSDGTWSDQVMKLPQARQIYWDGQRFVASGARQVHSSPDGSRWNRINCGMEFTVNDAAWNGHHHVAVGYVSWGWVTVYIPIIQVSTDGAQWTHVDLTDFGNEGVFSSVAWGDHGFVVVGADAVGLSQDGSSWQFYPFELPETVTGLVWSGDEYVVLTAQGTMKSSNGLAWSGPHQVWDDSIDDLEYHNPRIATNEAVFVVVQPDGSLAMSQDAITWETCVLESESPVADVVWTGADWVAVTLEQQIFVSDDGFVWQKEQVHWDPIPYNPEGERWVANRFRLAAGGNRVVAIAEGVSLVRDCIPPPPRRAGGRIP